jgi:hypothetical protein
MKELQKKIVSRYKYLDLVERVSRIDKDAAEYILNRAPTECKPFNYVSELGGAFVWDKTPQGQKYWQEINRKLESL